MNRRTGIYKITNTTNGRSYVGQSRDIYKRWKQHTQALPADPPTSLIQRAFNKYGLRQQVSRPGTYGKFRFEVLELCQEEDLLLREQHWIKNTKPEYNIALLPPISDIDPFKRKKATRTIIQYHNYAKERHFPGLPTDPQKCMDSHAFELGHYISTTKRMAINSTGDTVFLILGVKSLGRVQFFLWSTTIVEEVEFLPDEDLPINVIGGQSFYDPPAGLNAESGFVEFKRRCGNFAYGFQSIRQSDPFLSTLSRLSQKNILGTTVACTEYLERFFSFANINRI